MTPVWGLSDKDVKRTMDIKLRTLNNTLDPWTNVSMDVIEKVHNMHEQMENFSQEEEAIF